jgi:cytochrome oxidase Cu insertion factor (SCO1/SenC/PrrC family)
MNTRIPMATLRFAAVALVLGAWLGTAGAEERLALEQRLVLADADGKTVALDDFVGKWLLVYFGYIHCADQCPTALSAIVEALDEIGPAAQHIQPVFVTVDPERDRGPALRDFAAAFDKRLVGLTGTPEQLAAAARALGVQYEKVLAGSGDYAIDHSATLSVIGPDRREAVTFAMAEPYAIAAKLVALLERGGVALGNVNNLRAYRPAWP